MRRHSKKRVRVALAAVISLLIAVIFFGACSDQSGFSINEKTLRDRIKIGELISIGGLLNKAEDRICILYPYQSSLSGKDSMTVKINNYLKSVSYSADEGHWAFVYIGANVISIDRFKRSERLDILAPHEINENLKMKLPDRFQPTSCSFVKVGKFLKLNVSDRNYLVMGEIK